MPYASLRECTYPSCHVLVKGGRCAAHITKEHVQRDTDVKRLYNSPRWQAMRKSQLTKEPWCVDCLSKLAKYVFATDADHIVRHNGNPKLFFDETNLQSLCHYHHSSKTAGEVWHSND